MSYFEGMADEQIVAMSEAEVARIVDLECARQGVPLFLEPGPEPGMRVARDWDLFKVGPWTFDDRAAADRVAEAVNAGHRWKERYDWRYTNRIGEMERCGDEDRAIVELVQAFKPDTVHKYRAELERQKEERVAWDTQKKEAEKAYGNRSSIVSAVWGEYNAARDRIDERERLRKLFVQYVALADGNKETARKFLISAQKLDDSWQPEPGWMA